MATILAAEQYNLQFAVSAINRAANISLTDADVNGKTNLAGILASIETRKGASKPADAHEFETVENWITWLQGTGNFSDSLINGITNVRTTGDTHDLRFTFFTLITGLFTDATDFFTLVDHPNLLS